MKLQDLHNKAAIDNQLKRYAAITKAKKAAAVKAAALALEYCDFVTIQSALEVMAEYLKKNRKPYDVNTAEGCLETLEKIEALQKATREYFKD